MFSPRWTTALGRDSRFASAWLVLSLAAGSARGASEDGVVLPAPTRDATALRARSAHATTSNDGCADCHADIAEEWQASLHRRSWQDSVFQSAYAVEPLAFCRGCHAPGSDPARAPSRAAASSGVDCVTCHVRERGVVGVGTHAASADHAVVADARWATAEACAGCHQFDFPERSRQLVPEAMQDTAHEHARSRYADTPCQTCHMPVVGSGLSAHRSHDFRVLGDAAFIRGAAAVNASVVGRDVVVTIDANRVGHAFPTGDMFRRLEVRAESRDARSEVVARHRPVILARRFADVPRSSSTLESQRVQTSDDRVKPPGAGAPRRITFTPSAGAISLHYQVVYQRMSTPMARSFHVEPVLDEVVVAEGDVSLSSSESSRKAHP